MAVGLLTLAAGVLSTGAPARASAQDGYALVGCRATDIGNTQICLYRSRQDEGLLLGQFQNGASVGISNDGYFQFADGSRARTCGVAVTRNGTSTTCAFRPGPGRAVRLGDCYSESLVIPGRPLAPCRYVGTLTRGATTS